MQHTPTSGSYVKKQKLWRQNNSNVIPLLMCTSEDWYLPKATPLLPYGGLMENCPYEKKANTWKQVWSLSKWEEIMQTLPLFFSATFKDSSWLFDAKESHK